MDSAVIIVLGLKNNDIGTIGGGKRKPNGNIDVAMIQSLVHKNNVDDLVANYGHIIVDECHHLPAVSFERVLSAAKPRYIIGLTATPRRRDGHHPIITMQLGPVRFSIDSKNQAALRPFKHQLIIRDTTFTLPDEKESLGIQELYGLLTTHEERNDMIFNDILNSLEKGRSPLVLTERKEHLDLFAKRLKNFTRNLVVLHGGRTTKQRLSQLEKLASIPDNEERLVLATGRYIGEGFDDARLDTLFLALPVSWKGTLVQYTGRLHRTHPNKSEVQIYDYVDHMIPMLNKMFEKRLRGYSAIGYTAADTQSKTS